MGVGELSVLVGKERRIEKMGGRRAAVMLCMVFDLVARSLL